MPNLYIRYIILNIYHRLSNRYGIYDIYTYKYNYIDNLIEVNQ